MRTGAAAQSWPLSPKTSGEQWRIYLRFWIWARNTARRPSAPGSARVVFARSCLVSTGGHRVIHRRDAGRTVRGALLTVHHDRRHARDRPRASLTASWRLAVVMCTAAILAAAAAILAALLLPTIGRDVGMRGAHVTVVQRQATPDVVRASCLLLDQFDR